ncbi:MAG: RcnB family protein [Gammaproteobacteria bacterium]
MKIVIMSVLFASLGIGSAAMADPGARGRDGDRPNAQQDRHDDQHDSRGDHRDDHGNDGRGAPGMHRDDHNDRDNNHGRYGAYQHPKGYKDHRWARGERLPKAYYAKSYVVVNYQARGWRQPPRGYHWVRVNDDVVLAAIATGVVLDVLFNQF